MKNTINSTIYLFHLSTITSLFFVISCTYNNKLNSSSNSLTQIDSTKIFIEQSRSNNTPKSKKKYLLKAINYNRTLKNDTLRLQNLASIIEQANNLRDFNLLKKNNKERLSLAISLKDTFSIGSYHWLNGHYYYDHTIEKSDSAYFSYNRAYKLFEKTNRQYESALATIRMAQIKREIKDYTGSEKLIFQAIKKLKPLNKNTSLFTCYYLLASNFIDLKNYEKALFYEEKATKHLTKSKFREIYEPYNLNNFGDIYKSMRNYPKAIIHYQKALNSEKNKKSLFYATIKESLAYAKFKSGDTLNTEKELFETLKIRDSINFSTGIAITKLDLAEFYAFRGDTIKAIENIKNANKLSKSVKSHNYHLKGLKLLAKVDTKNKGHHLEEYIALNDSIQFEQRAIRNKFTRIEFETDEYIEETKRLSTQNILISVIGGILILVLALLYFIRRQRAKTKELLYESEQQKANEEIYTLMLKQQLKLEEGRTQERHRISEELHDGVLGKLFGTRVGLGFLSLSGGDEDVNDYKSYVEELQDIEKEIRDISHELKNNILKSENGYIAVIEDYINNLSKLKSFKYTLQNEDDIDWDAIDDKLKVTFYRIIQEASQNIVKHAQANTVGITFSKSSKLLHLVIKDDGAGFNIDNRKKGIGLKNMESRISKHQGQFLIDSKLGEGTTITINVAI